MCEKWFPVICLCAFTRWPDKEGKLRNGWPEKYYNIDETNTDRLPYRIQTILNDSYESAQLSFFAIRTMSLDKRTGLEATDIPVPIRGR